MNINIPKSFINQAAEMNMPEWIAKDIYFTKLNKLPVEKIARLLVRNSIADSESKARFMIRKLWENYHNPETSLMVSPFVEKEELLVLGDQQTYLDKAREGLESVIGKLGNPNPPVKKSTGRSIVCSDIHVPFHSEKALAQLLSEEADNIYVLADIIDSFAISKYRKVVEYINMRDELGLARAVIEKMAAKFQNVYLLKSGNHDNRIQKLVQEKMPQILPLLVHPTDLLASGLKNVHVISTEVPDTAPAVKYGKNYECDFFAIHDGVVFGHFENFSGANSLKQIEDWLEDWKDHLELDEMPKAIFNGHTHRLHASFTPKGRLLVSTGCLCKPMPYQLEGHGTYQPPTVGYCAFYRDPRTGIIDVNKTEVIYVGR